MEDNYVLFVNENGSFDILWLNGEEAQGMELKGILEGCLIFTKIIG